TTKTMLTTESPVKETQKPTDIKTDSPDKKRKREENPTDHKTKKMCTEEKQDQKKNSSDESQQNSCQGNSKIITEDNQKQSISSSTLGKVESPATVKENSNESTSIKEKTEDKSLESSPNMQKQNTTTC